MSFFPVRAPFACASLATLLFCAACGGPGGSGSGGSGGSGGSSSGTGASTSSTTTTSATTGSTGMDCDLQITDENGANVGITSFSSPVGQGNTKQKAGHPPEYGFAASATKDSVIKLLNITVSGDTLAVGDYTIANDDTSVVELTINDLNAGTGEGDWRAVTGSKVTVAAIGPGPVSHYKNVTFALNGVSMEPDPTLGAGNKAMGTFKMTGKCAGNIQDLQ